VWMSRRRVLQLVGVIALLALAAATASWWLLDRAVQAVPTFDDVQTTTSSSSIPRSRPSTSLPVAPTTLVLPDGSNMTALLVFSVGSKGVDGIEADRTAVGDERAEQSDGLTDSMALVLVDPSSDRVAVLSLPRDTWLDGRGRKLNSVYNLEGPQALADTVTALTGIEVNHMLQVNFAAVVDVVDALGGIEVTVPAAMRDQATGLDLAPGCQRLDGAQSLALVRSRKLDYDIGNGWVRDPTGDFGRMERTQQLAAAVLADPAALVADVPKLLAAASDNLVRDQGLDTAAILSLVTAVATASQVDMFQPPATPARRGDASVVIWDEPVPQIDALAAAQRVGRLSGAELDPTPTEPPRRSADPPRPPSPGGDAPEVNLTPVSAVPAITAGCTRR
jgi:LCP family protein required for cell wall assembly